jgi:hypothetical protein
MIRYAARHAVVGSPLTTLVLHGIPWWGIIIAVSLGPIAYICRNCLLYRLASKALDKVPSDQAVAVITAITGQPPPASPTSARTRRRERPAITPPL